MKTKRYTEIRICDLKPVIDSMCPIRIFINRKLVWDDCCRTVGIEETIKEYDEIMRKENLVRQLKFDIDEFHHSIVHIETTNKETYRLNTNCIVKDD